MLETPSEDNSGENPESEAQADGLQAARAEFAARMLLLRERDVIEHPSPKTWPRYPLLCLVHRRERDGASPFTRPGLIHASEPTTVAAVNLYELPAFGGSLTPAELNARLIRYESVEDLLADWRVD